MKETIVIIVTRQEGRKRRTVERAIDGVMLAAYVMPEKMWWWQLQRCRKELDEQQTVKHT